MGIEGKKRQEHRSDINLHLPEGASTCHITSNGERGWELWRPLGTGLHGTGGLQGGIHSGTHGILGSSGCHGGAGSSGSHGGAGSHGRAGSPGSHGWAASVALASPLGPATRALREIIVFEALRGPDVGTGALLGLHSGTVALPGPDVGNNSSL